MPNEFDQDNQTPQIDFTKPIDDSNLKGLSVLITGGANGLGSLITRRFCAAGARVTVADLQTEPGEKLVTELKAQGQHAFFVQTDVTKWESQVHAFKQAVRNSASGDSLDLVIPCAGTTGFPIKLPDAASLDEDPPAPSTMTFDVTLLGVYYSTCLALHYFRLPGSQTSTPGRRKHLLYIGSLASYVEVVPVSDYTASKFGVRGLWKSLRKTVRERGVRTNLLAPTFLPTQAVASVAAALEAKGAKLGGLDAAVEAVLRLACGEEIDARAVAVGGYGNFDLRDDTEGLDGGVEVLGYFRTGAFGSGMSGFGEVLAGRY